jgi:hypothetical protein
MEEALFDPLAKQSKRNTLSFEIGPLSEKIVGNTWEDLRRELANCTLVRIFTL